jgi:hypothetical protein
MTVLQDANIAYPEWTEYRKKNGLDPLGMQTGSINIYQRLLPGISNVTQRMRYYGLYAWLARTYARESGDTNPKNWQRCVRRAEALYALVAQNMGGETGVAGVEWASRTLGGTKGTAIDFAAAAEPGSEQYYLKQKWGVYGLAYASQLFEIGVFAEAKAHTIPVPSEAIGDRLAQSFADALPGVADAFFATVREGSVSLAALDKYVAMVPSGIAKNSDERACYEDILFAKAGLERPQDIDRRRSLMLALALTQQLGRVPGVFDVRWMLYAGYDSSQRPLQLPTELQAQRWRWWVYQANDLLHICYEALLKYSLDILGEYPAGISLSRLIGETATRILSASDGKPADWHSFLALQPPPDNCLLPDDRTGEVYLQRELMRKMRLDGVSAPEDAWLAVKLLAVLHNRVCGTPKNPKDELGQLDPGLVRSLVTELRFLDEHQREKFSVFLARLIEERVIRRHLWVGLRKFRYQGDYTFLIETDDGRVRRRAMDGPVFTNPRLGPALAFLRDIHLIGDQGLTARGEKLVGAA